MRGRSRAVEAGSHGRYTRSRTFGGAPMRITLAVGVVLLFASAAAGQPEPEDPSFHIERAAKAHRNGEYEKAIKECDRAIKLDPKFAAAYLLRATCRMANDDLLNAMRDYS